MRLQAAWTKPLTTCFVVLCLEACAASTSTQRQSAPELAQDCVEIQNNPLDDFELISIDPNKCLSRFVGSREVLAIPRAVIGKRDKRVTFQVYVLTDARNWFFFHSYRYNYREKPEPIRSLQKIDQSVTSSGTREDLALTLPREQFEFYAKIPMKLRLYGKRADADVEGSPSLYLSFTQERRGILGFGRLRCAIDDFVIL